MLVYLLQQPVELMCRQVFGCDVEVKEVEEQERYRYPCCHSEDDVVDGIEHGLAIILVEVQEVQANLIPIPLTDRH